MKMKKSKGNIAFDIVNYLVLFALAAVCIVPFLFVFSASVSPLEDILTRKFFIFPRNFDFKTYKYLLSSNTLINSIGLSFWITIIGTVLSMIFTVLTAYPLSKERLRGRRYFQFMIVFTMLFSGGMIPTYLIVSSLGLTDTLWSLWLPGLVSAYNTVLLRNFFQGIPNELEEAAIIDGCNDMTVLIKIILPLSLPALATFSLFHAVGYWNSYFSAILYINDSNKWPIQVWLRQIVILSSGGFSDNDAVSDMGYIPPQNISYAVIIFATLPILAVYPFAQKYFTKGLMLGSVKG
jgi:putative aldouronate transport system permease protein